MRWAILLVLAACGGSDADADAEPEVNPFPGNWKVIEFDGMPQSGVVVWTFGETTIAIGTDFTGTYTFDTSADPTRLELAIANATPNPNQAIYFFHDGKITIKVQDGAPDRATVFAIEDGYDVLVFDPL